MKVPHYLCEALYNISRHVNEMAFKPLCKNKVTVIILTMTKGYSFDNMLLLYPIIIHSTTKSLQTTKVLNVNMLASLFKLVSR